LLLDQASLDPALSSPVVESALSTRLARLSLYAS
jgi:hypothetical protein